MPEPSELDWGRGSAILSYLLSTTVEERWQLPAEMSIGGGIYLQTVLSPTLGKPRANSCLTSCSLSGLQCILVYLSQQQIRLIKQHTLKQYHTHLYHFCLRCAALILASSGVRHLTIWTMLMVSKRAYTSVKFAFRAVRQTDRSRSCNPSKFSSSLMTNSLLRPGACKKMSSHQVSAYRFSLRISPTLITCFFSWSRRIWEPMDWMEEPDCLSRLNCRSPALPRTTYLRSDRWRTQRPFQKIPKENDPPKQRIIPYLRIFTARTNSFSKLISPLMRYSSFFTAIFSRTSRCRFKMASILEKSSQSCPSANICSQSWVGRKSWPNPPLLQLRLGSRRERLRKMSSCVVVLRQKMQILLYSFLVRQLLESQS